MAKFLYVITVLLLSVKQISSACQCDKVSYVATYLQDSQIIHSPTTDGGYPTGTNLCNDEKNCTSRVSYDGLINGKPAAWNIVATKCDLQDGQLLVYDGPNLVKTIANSECKTTGYTPVLDESTNSDVKVTFLSGAKNLTVILFLNPQESSKAATTTTTTTVVPPGPGSGLQMELAVAIDLTYGVDSQEYSAMIDFAAALAEGLDIVVDTTEPPGVRATFLGITPEDIGSGGAPWSYDKDKFIGTVKNFPQFTQGTGKPKYSKALETLVKNGFEYVPPPTTEPTNHVQPRRNSPRTLIVIAPKDYELYNGSSFGTFLKEKDVWPVLVNFNSGDLVNLEKLLGTDVHKEKFNVGIDDPASYAKWFIEEVLMKGDNLCSPPLKDSSKAADLASSSTDPVTFRTKNFAVTKYGELTNGVAGRYCNYHNHRFGASGNKADYYVNITVVYELEAERDYLRIFDDQGREHAAFTGYDVFGSSICFRSSNFTAQFETDKQEVYGGFELKAYGVSSCT